MTDVVARVEPAFESLFATQFSAMHRLALLFGADDPENIAQEAFVRLHRRWRSLHDHDKALAYLRRTVTNLATSRLRHLRIAHRHRPTPSADAVSAETSVLDRSEHGALWAAVCQLPRRQRQVVVLRYWLDLSIEQVATTLTISPGTVKATSSHALTTLRQAMTES